MNAHSMLTKILSLVSFNMHKARQNALIACVQSLVAGNVATVTSMGRGICSKAYEKHRIKRADRLLSNQHLLSEVPSLYMTVSHLFCHAQHPVITVDWSDLDDRAGRFLLRAAMAVQTLFSAGRKLSFAGLSLYRTQSSQSRNGNRPSGLLLVELPKQWFGEANETVAPSPTICEIR